MRKKVFIFISIMAAIGLFLLLFSVNGSYSVSPAVAKNIQHPFVEGRDTYFFTGHGFAKYNADEQKTSSLTNFVRLPEIFEVDISSKGAVFKTAQAYPTDDLYFILKKKELPTNIFYWWYVDFSNGRISLVGEKEGFMREIVSAKWSDEGELIVGRQKQLSTTPELSLYKLDAGVFKQIYNRSGTFMAELVWVGGNHAVVSVNEPERNQIILYLIGFSNNTFDALPEVVGGSAVVGVGGKSLLAGGSIYQDQGSHDQSSTRELSFFLLGEDESSVLLDDFSGKVAPLPDGGFYIAGSSEGERILGRVSKDGDFERINVGEVPFDFLFASPVDAEHKQIAIVSSEARLYFIYKGEASFKEATSVPEGAKEIENRAYSVTYFGQTNSFSVLINKNPFRKNLEAALDDLESRGVDTNQYIINAQSIRSVRPDL